jgi:hypothetical protein
MAIERGGERLSRRRVFSASDADAGCGTMLNSYEKINLSKRLQLYEGSWWLVKSFFCAVTLLGHK